MGVWDGFYVFGIDDKKQLQLQSAIEHEIGTTLIVWEQVVLH
jgi:hypothetical protein